MYWPLSARAQFTVRDVLALTRSEVVLGCPTKKWQPGFFLAAILWRRRELNPRPEAPNAIPFHVLQQHQPQPAAPGQRSRPAAPVVGDDADLAKLIQAWGGLDGAARRAILALLPSHPSPKD